jgi:Mce-associated membrane protein
VIPSRTPSAPSRELEDLTTESTDSTATPLETTRKRTSRGQVVAYILLPLLVMLMAAGAGYLKYQDNSVAGAQTVAVSSVQAAKEGTIALLSYTPDTAQATLTAARDRLTGSFRDSYIALTNDVVIPGAKQKRISAAATVPAVATVSANPNRAVVLVFVDQSVSVGNDAPSTTASAVQVTLDKAGDRWLISGFDPK